MASSDSGSETGVPTGPSKADRRAARATVSTYHEGELARLIEHVRDGLAHYDSGGIDAFELDEIIHHYKRATQKLWTFCTGSGARVHSTATTIEWLRDQGELPDWWEQSTPRRARG
jgi:hypothetical protein